jgi:3D (Asp-Asp-Asp) domain-containing protein
VICRNIGVLLISCCLAFPCSAGADVPQRGIGVTVSAYTKFCSNSKTGKTACGVNLQPQHNKKVVALSRDLAKRFDFGDRFHLKIGNDVYPVVYLDNMPSKHKGKVDFLMGSRKECFQFGKRKGVLIPVK